ncbi:hypothetical protein PHMEG_00014429 [Phytophthora megakarya]|uniref:Uncharacterized protein n=1 Tax=Phytophthora megakarya TaxID=4795 RepID=A0A225W5W7_9STRA|nr:hypothetical protein PHMEG_00014429 [Phytophthora megakarya]
MASGANTATMVSFIDQNSQTVFCWLHWIAGCNLSFSSCEGSCVSKYSNLDIISTDTLLKYAGLVMRQVEISISVSKSHDDGAYKMVLAFAPLIDDDVTDHTSDSHVKFLEEILLFFDCKIEDVAYLIGDNCAVNTKLAGLPSIPLIGCV